VNQLVLTIRPDYPGINGAVGAVNASVQQTPDTAALALAASVTKGKK
jgi:hypothetical protein